MKRGAKLKSNPNAPSFLEKEIVRLETEWKDTNEKAKIRLDMLQGEYLSFQFRLGGFCLYV